MQAILVFLIIAIMYLLYGSWGFNKIKSPFDYFHSLDKRNKNVKSLIYSLTVSNIALGTGFVYLIQGGLTNGFLFLLTAVSVWLGYFLLGNFIDKLPDSITSDTGKNFIKAIDAKITEQRGKTSVFRILLSYSLIIVFVLILSFEIFASSQIISAVVFHDITKNHQVIIAAILSGTVLVYTTLNGIRGVVRTGQMQFAAVTISMFAFVWFIFKQPDFSISHTIAKQYTLNYRSIIVPILTSCLLAIATQFYSIINFGIITHLPQTDRKSLLRGAGIWISIFLFIISLMGVVYPSQNANDNFINRLTNNNLTDTLPLQIIIIFGFLSMTFSTIDAVIMNLSQFYNDNIENSNSEDKTVNNGLVNKVRLKTILFVSITLLFLGFFNFNQPNLYYLLLGIGGPIAVFTPMIFLAGKLSIKNELYKLSNKSVVFFFLLFILSHVIYFGGIAFKDQVITSYTSISAFFISAIFAIYLYYEAKR